MQFPKPPPDRRKKHNTITIDSKKDNNNNSNNNINNNNQRIIKTDNTIQRSNTNEEVRQQPISYEELFKGLKDDNEEDEKNTLQRARKGQNLKMRNVLKDYIILSNQIESRDHIPKDLNIILFGPTGSGKSSLIKTFYQALNEVEDIPNEIKKYLIVQSLHHNEGTKKLSSVVVKQGKQEIIETKNNTFRIENSTIKCLDTRGQIYLSEQEMKQFNLIIDGKVKNLSLVEQRNYRYAYYLWEFWKKSSELFPEDILQENQSLETLPHCVIIVFDGSLDEIPNGEEETLFYKQILESLKQRNYFQPQIVMSRLDLVEKKMKNVFDKHENMTESEKQMKMSEVIDLKIQQVVNKLQIPRSSVHFIENYNALNPKFDENVNYYTLKLLLECTKQGDTFIEQYLLKKQQSQSFLDKCIIF